MAATVLLISENSEIDMSIKTKTKSRFAVALVCLVLCGVLLNVAMTLLCSVWKIPVYLDDLGTVLTSLLGGALPGVLTAFVSCLIRGMWDTTALYFGSVYAVIAVIISFMQSRGVFRSVWKSIAALFGLSVVDAAAGALISGYLYGYGGGRSAVFFRLIDSGGDLSKTATHILASLCVSFIVWLSTLLVAALIYRLIPRALKERLSVIFNRNRGDSSKYSKVSRSLMKKIIALIFVAELLLGALAYSISFFIYRQVAVEKYTDICRGVTDVAALTLDPERVDEYIENGKNAGGYSEMLDKLYAIRDSFPQTQYIYCYRIEEKGCRVVFDLDSPDTEGSEVGSTVEFDESFNEYLPTLFAGGEIEPIITDDTYGWLLTVYKPIRNSAGECVCYVAADVDMGDVITDETVFIIKLLSLFIGFSIVIMVAVLELVKRGIVFPINEMADAANSFAFDSEVGRSASLERLKSLDINSKDEIQNLYTAISKMAEDSSDYIDTVNKQSKLITKMQENIIVDFAEMVEARDKCTGDHIKKTSFYVEKIARELQREGKFGGAMTDDYIARLVRSAPLHDVGKIKISDLILNKPGRLTDEEFELMKTHTSEGKAILTHTNSVDNSKGYLKEAIEMANYHHERWDGKGYPCGAKGEEIPISARIMAVADVFDALVSRRSYKEPFSFEKATDIIREESGTHFDPTVVEAFLNIARDAYDEYERNNPPEDQPPKEE